MLLNLFDVAAHFSPRLWFWAHFTKNLFQNSWLGVIIATRRNYCVISEHFAAHLKELRAPPVEKRCCRTQIRLREIYHHATKLSEKRMKCFFNFKPLKGVNIVSTLLGWVNSTRNSPDFTRLAALPRLTKSYVWGAAYKCTKNVFYFTVKQSCAQNQL